VGNHCSKGSAATRWLKDLRSLHQGKEDRVADSCYFTLSDTFLPQCAAPSYSNICLDYGGAYFGVEKELSYTYYLSHIPTMTPGKHTEVVSCPI
jgi:hypothetical protein